MNGSPPILPSKEAASTRGTGDWRDRSPSCRSAGSVPSAKRWRGGSKRGCPDAAARSDGRSSPPRLKSSFSIRPTMRPSTSRSRRRAPSRPAPHSPRSPTPCCAPSPATATKSSPVPTPWRTIRPLGSPNAGARPMARASRAPSLQRIARSRRSTSASKATRLVGRSGWAESSCRPARCASTPTRPSPSSKAMRTANGGCRTLRRPCRPGSSGRLPACGSSISAPRRAEGGADFTAVARPAGRLKLLAANFARLRLRTEVVVADALTFEAAPFDAVLLDAPCSATGTIRRHPDVAWIKRPGDLAPLVKLQADLLDRAIALARPGGAIVYCVCSLEPEEGEAQIASVLRRNPDVRRLAVAPEEIGGLAECLTLSGDLRTLPCHLWGDDPRRSGLDGFFAARLVKRG